MCIISYNISAIKSCKLKKNEEKENISDAVPPCITEFFTFISD